MDNAFGVACVAKLYIELNTMVMGGWPLVSCQQLWQGICNFGTPWHKVQGTTKALLTFYNILYIAKAIITSVTWLDWSVTY